MSFILRRSSVALLSGSVLFGCADAASDVGRGRLEEPTRLQAAGPGDDAGAVTPPPSCPATRLRPGETRGTLRHGNRQRSYLLHVPASYRGEQPVPLVVDMHGYSRSAATQKSESGWDEVAAREGLLVVYPEGVSRSWNVGGCCGGAGSANVDDVGFVRALVAKLSAEACIDPERVYASGVSNGAGMAGRLGCEAADVIRGVALVSSDLRTSPCKPVRPVTEIAFRGTADTLEPFEGGLVGPPGGQFRSPGARGSFELWRAVNQCTGTPTKTGQYCETYTECAADAEVTLCTMPGVGHSPYNNRLGLDIAQASWEAFERAADE